MQDSTISQAFEFSNVNPAYYGRPYQFAYMLKNMYSRYSSLVKLNVETGNVTEFEFPDGAAL